MIEHRLYSRHPSRHALNADIVYDFGVLKDNKRVMIAICIPCVAGGWDIESQIAYPIEEARDKYNELMDEGWIVVDIDSNTRQARAEWYSTNKRK